MAEIWKCPWCQHSNKDIRGLLGVTLCANCCRERGTSPEGGSKCGYEEGVRLGGGNLGGNLGGSRDRQGKLGVPPDIDLESALPPLTNKGVFVLAIDVANHLRNKLNDTRPDLYDAIGTAESISDKCFQSVNAERLRKMCREFCNWFWSAPNTNAALPDWIEFENEEEK